MMVSAGVFRIPFYDRGCENAAHVIFIGDALYCGRVIPRGLNGRKTCTYQTESTCYTSGDCQRGCGFADYQGKTREEIDTLRRNITVTGAESSPEKLPDPLRYYRDKFESLMMRGEISYGDGDNALPVF